MTSGMSSFEDITDGHNEVQEEEIILPSDPVQSPRRGQDVGDVKWKSVSLKAWLKASSEHNDRSTNVSRPPSEVSVSIQLSLIQFNLWFTFYLFRLTLTRLDLT